ncbi:cytochrome P450 [Penicillium capsulatum]|uniref:Cytochrome P450 n=1 Tax=Penicillium capsulatum TaxID=69766 RepID=A0A9W9LHE4_9EURO|nr:cytochrome P450 [Penicillium capsulatum]KAJ6106306.1 cytochrome P450 [Penicillium capsulatum]
MSFNGSIHEALPRHGILHQLQPQLSTELVLKLSSTLLAAYVIGYVIYNLFFHPLRNYPGPFWARASLLWRIYRSMDGRFHRHIEDCHKRYGIVFRVSPNELSFCSPGAWTAIYTPSHKGVAKILKNEFYDMFGAGFEIQSMGTERDPVLAHQKRALFSSALSAKGLAQQEPVMQKNVNLFVEKLGMLGNSDRGIDMAKWFIYLGFDILGEMAFGDSFGCIEREASHPWLDLMLGLMHVVTVMDNLRRYPILVKLAQCIPSKWTVGFRDQMIQYGKSRTAARLEKQGEHNDFLTNVVEKVRSGEVSQAEMEAHSWNMAMAGGETSGSAMASIIYFILKNPTVHRKLNDEVRSAYTSFDDINISSTTQLEYLMAVLKEGMRIFPTAPQGTPRISPGVEVEGHFVPKGAEFYVSPWAVTHDERYWHEPYAFKPERWIDVECTDNRAASQPFSLGPRVCPGKLFAFGQMALQLAKMVYAHDMELVDPDLDWINTCKMHFLWWKPALNVRFTPVQHK